MMATTAAPPRARCVARIRLPPAWTEEEDARLQCLAMENGFGHWRRVARRMPRRSARSCRDRWRNHLAHDVYYRPFTARDDDELLRLHYRLGDRWKDIGRAVYGRSSCIMKRRWNELRRSGFPAAARKVDRVAAGYPPLDADTEAMESEEPESESLPPPRAPEHHDLDDLLASSFSSCSLACDDAVDPLAGILVLGFACMAV